jgi:hypothetical protein
MPVMKHGRKKDAESMKPYRKVRRTSSPVEVSERRRASTIGAISRSIDETAKRRKISSKRLESAKTLDDPREAFQSLWR